MGEILMWKSIQAGTVLSQIVYIFALLCLSTVHQSLVLCACVLSEPSAVVVHSVQSPVAVTNGP